MWIGVVQVYLREKVKITILMDASFNDFLYVYIYQWCMWMGVVLVYLGENIKNTILMDASLKDF